MNFKKKFTIIQIARKTSKNGVFSGPYFPLTEQKKLRIWALFKQCVLQQIGEEKYLLIVLQIFQLLGNTQTISMVNSILLKSHPTALQKH